MFVQPIDYALVVWFALAALSMLYVAVDQYRNNPDTIPESGRYLADTVNVGPGQRYDVVWTARQSGKWLIHCRIPHHTANDNTEQKGRRSPDGSH